VEVFEGDYWRFVFITGCKNDVRRRCTLWPIDLLLSSIAKYPSGHAYMALLFYLMIAVFLTRKQRRSEVRVYTFVFSSIIIFLIGISRILGAQHNLTEVLAGWSLAMIWLTRCWLIERFIKLHYKWDV